MIIDTSAGPSGQKEGNDGPEGEKAHNESKKEINTETNEDQHQKSIEEDPEMTQEENPQKSTENPLKSPEKNSEETPKETTHTTNSPPKPPPRIEIPSQSEEENILYSPIQDSDSPETKAKKDEYFTAKAYLHAEGFETDSDQEISNPIIAGTSGSKPDFSKLFMFRPLNDSDFKPQRSYNPPPTPEQNWDIPLTPNRDKYVYSLNFSRLPKIHKDLSIRVRNQKFLNKFTQPQLKTWSIEPIIKVVSVKKRTFEKANFFEYEIIIKSD
ncbi:hypothetical protein L1887_28096 [Cichorium endivia]|nr:hypothetical protein L1887_28096 [Cichorium endivia]